MKKARNHELASLRHLGHDLGLQILVDDQVPSKFTVTDESEEIAMDSLEDVAELLEAKRKERVIYDDGFVVVYCHPNFAMTAINGDSGKDRGMRLKQSNGAFTHTMLGQCCNLTLIHLRGF